MVDLVRSIDWEELTLDASIVVGVNVKPNELVMLIAALVATWERTEMRQKILRTSVFRY
jgi:mannitol/fructose-specific phosphotransferase system IIA component